MRATTTIDSIARALLGGSYLALVGIAVSDDALGVELLAAAVAAATVLLTLGPARNVLRFIAAAHAIVGVSLFHWVYWRSGHVELDPIGYGLMHVLIPLGVALFLVEDRRPGKVEGLPAGYEYLRRHRFYLTPLRKFAILAVATALLPVLMGGNILLFLVAITLLPVWILATTIASIVRSRRTENVNVARRIRLRSQRTGPAQTRSYWTVNSAPFRVDPEDES